MGNKKHQTYTHGEIIEKLDKIESHLKYLEAKHETSQIYATGVAILGFVFGIFAIGLAVKAEYSLSYLIAGIAFVVLAVVALRIAKKREEQLGAPPE